MFYKSLLIVPLTASFHAKTNKTIPLHLQLLNYPLSYTFMPRFSSSKNRSHFISFIEPFPSAKFPTQNHPHLPRSPPRSPSLLKCFNYVQPRSPPLCLPPLPSAGFAPMQDPGALNYYNLLSRSSRSPLPLSGGLHRAPYNTYYTYRLSLLDWPGWLKTVVVNSVLTGKWKFPSSPPRPHCSL